MAFLWGCGAPEAGEFRIGLLAAGGDRYWAPSGAPSVRGAQLAQEEINAAGGITIGGRPFRVRIIVREYQARPDAAATEARRLLNQDSVHALVGPQLSAHAIPVSVIANGARVPMISPMSTNPETTRGKPFVFRLAALDNIQAEAMASYALERLQITRAAVLYDEADAYSRDLARRFREAFQEGGGTIVALESYTTDLARDFSEQMARIAVQEPEALYLPNRAREDTLQVRQAREAGIDAQILGGDTWDLTAYAQLPLAQGVIVTHQWHYHLSDPEVVAFLDRFRARYNQTPRTTAAMTYDAVQILTRAAERAGTLDPVAVRDAVAGTENFRGATGTISFRGGQDPDRSIAISTIRNGAVEVLESIHP